MSLSNLVRIGLFVLSTSILFSLKPVVPIQKAQISERADFTQCLSTYDCYVDELKKELKTNGIKTVLEELAKLSNENNLVRTYCHSIAHEL